MGKFKKSITDILQKFYEQDLLTNISQVYSFNDDPQVFLYSAEVECNKSITDGDKRKIKGSGFSLDSKEYALFKCLIETVERLGCLLYKDKSFLNGSYINLSKKYKLIDLDFFNKSPQVKKTKLKWIRGIDLVSGEGIYIPAQLVFLNYKYQGEFRLMAETNSTGCAGGTVEEDTQLRGIYEVVERDAYMSVFLAQITPPRVSLKSIKDTKVQRIIELCQRYKLDLETWDLTHDLGIHTFMSFLIDKTGLGPFFTSGLKANLDPLKALLGSIEEAFNTRPGMRRGLYKKQSLGFTKKSRLERIESIEERSEYWMSVQRINKLNFLFEGSKVVWKYKTYKRSSTEQLKTIMRIFEEKKFHVYFVDISPKVIFENLLVYKIFIPQLQPFYLRESSKRVNDQRLHSVLNFFGERNLKINPLPHFFL